MAATIFKDNYFGSQLAHGADPTMKNQEGQTPLDLAQVSCFAFVNLSIYLYFMWTSLFLVKLFYPPFVVVAHVSIEEDMLKTRTKKLKGRIIMMVALLGMNIFALGLEALQHSARGNCKNSTPLFILLYALSLCCYLRVLKVQACYRLLL